MKIVIGGDSAGKGLADLLVQHVSKAPGVEVIDVSTQPEDKEFYADLSERAALRILSGEAERGILVCGTGIGVCISANKVAGIRAALTHDTYSAERAAKSNNAHIITMGARVIGPELAKSIVDTWLASEFDPASSSGPNVDAIDRLSSRYGKAS